MSTDTLSCMDIDLSIPHVSPSEQLITLTLGQLQDFITQAIERATAPFEARIQDLEETTARERAFDRQRIARLERAGSTASPEG